MGDRVCAVLLLLAFDTDFVLLPLLRDVDADDDGCVNATQVMGAPTYPEISKWQLLKVKCFPHAPQTSFLICRSGRLGTL